MDLTLASLVLGSIAILLAGILRGFSGFGIAVAGVPLLSLVIEPRLVVPSIMLLQVASGVHNLTMDRRHIEWPILVSLMPGACLGILPGLWLLLWLSADVARLGIGLLIVATVLFLHRGLGLVVLPGRKALFGIGVVSGVLHGFAAIAGPPVIALFFALRRPPDITRATLAAYFLFTGILGLGLALAVGVASLGDFWFGLALCPALFVGLALGSRLFVSDFRRHYHRIGLGLLLVVGFSAALKGATGLLG